MSRLLGSEKNNLIPGLPNSVKNLLEFGRSDEDKEKNLSIPMELSARLALYPENRRRPVNKTIYDNEYFQLILNTKNNTLAISSKGDLIYSAIPYDTARNYIQKSVIQSILHPVETRKYIESHKSNLETYLVLSIYQVTGKRVPKDSTEVQEAYNQIFEDTLFEMQILGRLLQHDETGALSANLAGKFLYSENVKTGISPYISEYLKFVVEVTQALPIMTDGKDVRLLGDDFSRIQENSIKRRSQIPKQIDGPIIEEMSVVLDKDSEIALGLTRLPNVLQREILTIIDLRSAPSITQPLLRSKVGHELAEVRKNYVAHSRHPQELEKYFENVLPKENNHQINVLSDIHTMNGQLPFSNSNFNILVGDISDSRASNLEIKGIYVIGNHDLSDSLSLPEIRQDEKWDQYRENQWFNDLIEDPSEAWPKLPTGDNDFYKLIEENIASRFPKMNILNNDAMVHQGVRYIGLTIPVALVKRKEKVQSYILKSLNRLLSDNTKIPTVIVSHAPLFNELSMLPSKSQSYNKDNFCENLGIEELFKQYNIIGAIHGHHHIPASKGRYKKVSFVGKDLFVVCSIYSKMNIGFELLDLLPVDKKR